MLSSCNNIGPCAATLAAANLLLFTAFPWIWQKRVGTQRGTTMVFLLFLSTFTLFLMASSLAVLEGPGCGLLFCVACFLNVPAVTSVWFFVRAHMEDRERLESKVFQKQGEKTPEKNQKQK